LIAVDRATKENGCLQVIKGSHHLGRIEHGTTGDQVGADMTRVEAALKNLELVYCELAPGSALFFHGNLLHASAQNKSANPRWSLIGCYSTASNPVLNRPAEAFERTLTCCQEEEIKHIGRRTWQQLESAPAASSA
jgi:ectoine hydroxylase